MTLRKKNMILIFLYLIFMIESTSCFAVHSPSSSPSTSLSSSSSSSIIVSKKDGGISQEFILDNDNGCPSNDNNDMITTSSKKQTNKHSVFHIKTHLQKTLSSLHTTFLPSGYPTRTPSGYLTYSIYSWIQHLTTELRSVLATQRILEGVGVGVNEATALSASLNFIVRDGCGMVASLLFTGLAASKFRHDVKRWRLFADVIVDFGITLEVAATMVPKSLFLFMICIGNMCKAICGVASGACGGSINLHWAKGSDISDINAKSGAQNTLVGGLGLVSAALFARSISSASQVVLWSLYSSLTALHIYANVQCMKSVAFEYLSTARINMIAPTFLSSWNNSDDSGSASTDSSHSLTSENEEKKNDKQIIPLDTPEIISKKEPLFFINLGNRNRHIIKPPFPVHFGVSFNKLATLSGKATSTLQELLQMSEKKRMNANHDSNRSYAISVGQQYRYGGRLVNRCILVAIKEGTDPVTKAKAYFHSILLGEKLVKQGVQHSYNSWGRKKQSAEELNNMIRLAEEEAQAELDSAWGSFVCSASAAGWDISKTDLKTEGYEFIMIT
mmetsp:Transcript_8452/g.12428  ORF Transcript_8452/g.12428 Transcript_8452/m.12428 type:complete len:559 (+) Transcript_8452:122-1798(+)